MDMPQPSAGHARLKALAGHWEGPETMHPSQWDPAGGTAIGRNRSRMALNGFALITDYEQERHGAVTFAGHGVMTFDPRTALYTLLWHDSMGSPPEAFTGTFDGDCLSVSHGGPGMHARLTYDISDPGCLVSSMALSSDGVEWRTLFDARYRRVPASAGLRPRSAVMCGHRYRNAPAAIDWLCRAFGFVRHAVYEGPEGTIAHAELALDGGMIFVGSMNDTPFASMIAQPDEIGGRETRSVYLLVADADVVYRQAQAAGADIVLDIEDASYGGRGFTCRDPEGRLWSVGTYDPWQVREQPA